jgi:hypothetical protein
MIKVKQKYVYECDKMKTFSGMIRLDVCITLSYFNHDDSSFSDFLMSNIELSIFLTECLVELYTREKIDLSKIKIAAENFYISAMPSSINEEPRKIMAIKFADKKFIVSEIVFSNEDGRKLDSLKMRNIPKEELLNLMLNSNKLSMLLIDDVVSKCANSKKVALIENEQKENDNDKLNNKFDLSNYDQIT